jgi:eukaryotic-like serine/threonine-protein kinase
MDAATENKLDSLVRRWLEQQRQGKHIPLAELCRDCPDLLPELIRRVRAERADTQAGPEPTRVMAAVPSADVPLEDLPVEEPPVIVPGYEFKGELGKGGMGVVYKAYDPKLKRLVAIKMLPAGADIPPQHRQRFKTETEVVAQLKHPNIVQIYECGEQDGQPYCVLEYVEGGTLHDKLARQPQPPRDVAQLIAVLARGMHAAHRKGIVHRDLKPANVLMEDVSYAPGVSTIWGCPKITDFGLVKRVGTAPGPTTEGTLLGTPSYMSPEQASGENRRVGPASDIYSLGTIMFEALTGRPPFHSRNPVETLIKVLEELPPPPSSLCSAVPPELDQICLRCLEKEPTSRYPNAAALAEDLERFLQSAAGKPAPQQGGNKWLLAAAVVLAVLAVILCLIWLSKP